MLRSNSVFMKIYHFDESARNFIAPLEGIGYRVMSNTHPTKGTIYSLHAIERKPACDDGCYGRNGCHDSQPHRRAPRP